MTTCQNYYELFARHMIKNIYSKELILPRSTDKPNTGYIITLHYEYVIFAFLYKKWREKIILKKPPLVNA